MALTENTVSAMVDRVVESADRLGFPLYSTHFELVSTCQLNQLASYGGMPVRYRHWSFGKLFGHYQTAYDFRQSRIYEMVINHDPAYAFLDRAMEPTRTLVVLAHVLAHVAYFRSHAAFLHTASDEVSVMAEHRRAMESYQRRYGRQTLEAFVDAALVMADFTAESVRNRSMGEEPDDLLGFLALYAPGLDAWQRHILTMLHQEARYFWPQQLTKVANEGYATFWHRRILSGLRLTADEVLAMAKTNAELVQVTPPQLNPYRLGYLLVQQAQMVDGERGMLRVAKELFDTGLVREYLTADAVRISGLQVSRTDPAKVEPEKNWTEVKQSLLADLDHAGLPRLTVDQKTSLNTGCLQLIHRHTGRDLDYPMLTQALTLVAEQIWRGEVVITTKYRGMTHRLRHDGETVRDEVIGEAMT